MFWTICVMNKETHTLYISVGTLILWMRPKKKLFDWRNPTDPIFTADPKYFYFFVCKKKKKKKKKLKNPVEQIFSFSIALWCLHRVEKPPNPKNVLQKKWRCAFVPFVFVCVSYILCSGMWNIDLKKKKKKSDLPTLFFFSMLRQSNNFFF